MNKGKRIAVYDENLKIESYTLKGFVNPFPNHFHDFFVIGLMEDGERLLSCRNSEYTLKKHSMILFNPGDNHACSPSEGISMDYKAINIPKDVMNSMAKELTGKTEMPGFSQNVIEDFEAEKYFMKLHEKIMIGSKEFDKEESFILLMTILIQKYCKMFDLCPEEHSEGINKACSYMEENYSKNISLDCLSKISGLSKSTLLRSFTKNKGITPYNYLQSIRINHAKKMLENGTGIMEAAMETGFSDQSHFTNYFHQYIGLTPGSYSSIFSKHI